MPLRTHEQRSSVPRMHTDSGFAEIDTNPGPVSDDAREALVQRYSKRPSPAEQFAGVVLALFMGVLLAAALVSWWSS